MAHSHHQDRDAFSRPDPDHQPAKLVGFDIPSKSRGERLLDRASHARRRTRLDEKIVCQRVARERSDLFGAREDDAKGIGERVANVREQLEPADLRHLHVRNDDCETLLLERLNRGNTAERDADLPAIAVFPEGPLQCRQDLRIVVHEQYAPAFAAAFPGEASPVDFDHATKAIAAFERTLITPGRWDAFLAGDTKALDHQEVEGIKVFADLGCVQCHTGDLVGGLMFQRTGAIVPWPNQKDQGRFEITGNEADRMVFKVPSLRNVAITGPYFHDGSIADLFEAVQMMGTHQLGIAITDDETRAIVAWLGTLTGEAPKSALEPRCFPTKPRRARVPSWAIRRARCCPCGWSWRTPWPRWRARGSRDRSAGIRGRRDTRLA